jgi:hypothetical protein
MFERYKENARRMVFFARYEASQYGSPQIGPEHLLLGWCMKNSSWERPDFVSGAYSDLT